MGSNIIGFDYPSGPYVYMFIRNPADGKIRDVVANAWDTYAAGDVDDYNIQSTDHGGDYRTVTFDANTPAGTYDLQFKVQNSAVSDTPSANDVTAFWIRNYVWDGSTEVFDPTTILKAAKIRANKGVQTKSTGAIVHYDNDGTTPLYNETETDDETTITRQIADA